MSEGDLQILLVEDNSRDADLLIEGLSAPDARFQIVAVDCMAGAEQYLQAQRPADVVLLDLGLPDSEGLATLERAVRAAPRLPIIVLTGLEDEALAVESLRQGAQEYLVKGEVRARVLMRAIHHAVERKRLAEQLRDSEERLRLALRAGRMATWDWHVPSGEIIWNDEHYRFLGYRPGSVKPSYQAWADRVHPQDREATQRLLQQSMEQGGDYRAEYRVLWPDGSERWVEARGYVEPDVAGHPRRAYGVMIDITERKQAEESLREAKAAAEAANEAKGQFLANMSHELRTPMNAILGMIDVALPKAADPIVQDCLQTAKGSADLLLTLLNDLLDSAKIESGKLELEAAPFSLRRMLDQITRVLSVRASEKGLTFYCRMPDGTPDAVVGDRMRVQQVLLNLASNAIKFTERGEVEISLRAVLQDGDAHLAFAVRDTGIGIRPSGQERIFLPFGQADSSMSRRFGGTGLGLSISKSLVELMGGSIWVESELGVGSTFSFRLRLPVAGELPPDFEGPRVLPTAARGQLRVLLVEDNPANQKLATYILQDRGHLVDIAGDGQEAIYLTGQSRYDVILMDVQMPGMNGLEATAAIRQRENRGRRVPIIAMTAHAMRGDRERCLAAGMDGYLPKPVNAQEMIGLVESLAGEGLGMEDWGFEAQQPTTSDSGTPLPDPQTPNPVFDPDEALARCCHSADMVREMLRCFFDEVHILFPQMRAALETEDLVEVGRLGHRLKGTVIYLGARAAEEAALRVERFCKGAGGTASQAEHAVDALEHECIALKAALARHPLAAHPAQAEER